ncbi:MAG: hypothetical protein ACOYNI_12510 [Acidimicrobiia bacterium]
MLGIRRLLTATALGLTATAALGACAPAPTAPPTQVRVQYQVDDPNGGSKALPSYVGPDDPGLTGVKADLAPGAAGPWFNAADGKQVIVEGVTYSHHVKSVTCVDQNGAVVASGPGYVAAPNYQEFFTPAAGSSVTCTVAAHQYYGDLLVDSKLGFVSATNIDGTALAPTYQFPVTSMSQDRVIFLDFVKGATSKEVKLSRPGATAITCREANEFRGTPLRTWTTKATSGTATITVQRDLSTDCTFE